MVGMKHGSNQRRGRSRGGNGGKRHQSSRNQSFDSNGPEGKVRGSAQQVYDKYLSLARDAASSGEHIAAEGFYQFAEHYYRVANADGANNQSQNRQQQGAQQNDQQNDQQDSQSEGNEPQGQSREASQQNETVAADDGNKPEQQPRRRRSPKKAVSEADTDSSAPVEASVDAGVDEVAEAKPAKPAKSDAAESDKKDDLAVSA